MHSPDETSRQVAQSDDVIESDAARIAVACSYCGRENPDHLVHCPGCGTYLSSEPPPEKAKSRVTAIVLAICFGPLGLLYVSASLGITMFVIGIVVFIPVTVAEPRVGAFFAVAFRILCVFLAVQKLRAEPPDAEALELLDDAARLEKQNPKEAIAVYENIVARFPGSNPGREAVRNIAVLKKHLVEDR